MALPIDNTPTRWTPKSLLDLPDEEEREMPINWTRTDCYDLPMSCDLCGARANTIHLLPWKSDTKRAVLACPKHDAGGYWFPITDWIKHGNDSMRMHLWREYESDAIALVEERFERAATAAAEEDRKA